jgi:hypothetical protein
MTAAGPTAMWPANLVGDGDAARTAVGVIALTALLAVLLLREIARAGLDDARARRLDDLRFATWPLTVVFIAVVVPRILDLLR